MNLRGRNTRLSIQSVDEPRKDTCRCCDLNRYRKAGQTVRQRNVLKRQSRLHTATAGFPVPSHKTGLRMDVGMETALSALIAE